MTKRVTTLIMGGGQGRRLSPLTHYRSKPAVPIGGKYRLVDIPISNCINSGLKRIFVLTQFNSTSLHRHIHRTYPYELFNQTSVELLAAEQTISNSDWFQGTADAVRKHLPHYHIDETDAFLILSGDHLYRMDYNEILRFHKERNADVTIATIPVSQKDVSQFGIMQMNANGRISAFREKPSPRENIDNLVMPETIRKAFNVKKKSDRYLASMGIYVFKPSVLVEMLAGKEADFGKEVIPKSISKFQVYGFVFNGYWRDIGTIRSFYDVNIDLTKPNPPFQFQSPEGSMITRARFLSPSAIQSAELHNVMIGDGCQLQGVHIEDSVVGLRSVIRSGTVIRRSVLMGNDYYEYERRPKAMPLGIGKNCQIENSILDKNVHIGNRVSITNSSKVREKDGENYYIREGIVIIPKGAIIKDGTKI